MKIAIDARFYGSGHTGLGRYTTNVLKYLPKYLSDHTLQVLLRDAEYDNFPERKNIVKIHAEIPHYTLSEQLKLPGLLKSLGSDLLYTLHLNTPILSRIPKVVTIHDLIKSHYTGSDTTTRAPWLYTVKRVGYNQVINQTLEKARDIIVPSNTVKNDILAMFTHIKPELIHPIAEAPDVAFRSSKGAKEADILKNLPTNFILFVGNVYPHKNLKVLLEAMRHLPDTKLVIVAKQSVFLSRTLAGYNQSQLTILSDLSDAQLVEIYRHAAVLVTPSLMEGYGLVGLEALMVGTPVIASNIPVYREVYGDKVTYFDPHSVSSLVDAIQSSVIGHRPSAITFPRTWDDVAKSIAEVIHARLPSL